MPKVCVLGTSVAMFYTQVFVIRVRLCMDNLCRVFLFKVSFEEIEFVCFSM